MKQPTSDQIKTWAAEIRLSDRNAFNALFRSLYYPLTYFAYNYTGSYEQACDIVQDVFVSIWQDRSDIDPDQSLKSYLYRMVRNRSLNHLRDHENRMVKLDLVDLPAVSQPEYGNENNNTEELTVMFAEWIEELSDRRREAFKLSRYEGLDHDEIAEVMNLSVKTVNNHIVDALSHLRERYNNHKRS